MKQYVFIKRRVSIPEIKDNKIINPKAGGIKLEYDVYVTDNIHIRIGKRDIYIPFWKYDPQRYVFLKMFKKYWDQEIHKLPNNYYSKKEQMWLKLWVILKSRYGHFDCYEDVVDIRKDLHKLRIRTLCTKREHHKIIKNLDRGVNKFVVPYVQIIF